MTLDESIIITCLVLAVAFRALYQYFSWNVWLRIPRGRREHRRVQNLSRLRCKPRPRRNLF